MVQISAVKKKYTKFSTFAALFFRIVQHFSRPRVVQIVQTENFNAMLRTLAIKCLSFSFRVVLQQFILPG